MSIRTNPFAALISAVVLTIGTGCSVFDGSDDDSSSRDRTTSVDGLRNSDSVREGRGRLTYTANADGTVYVVNTQSEQVVLQQRIRRGQEIEVAPDENRVRIDNETVSKSDLKREDPHRIYLVRDRDAGRDDARTSSRPPRGVPGDAQLMGEGKNKEISFSPSRTGAVYVYDADERRLVARIPIRDGEKFVLSPGRERASVDGKAVEEGRFDTTANYRVYFNREE